MKKTFVGILVLVLILSSVSVLAEKKTEWNWPDKRVVCRFSADLASTWRTIESEDMQAVAEARNVRLAITNAEGDTGRQISDVESLVAQGCNVIVIVALDADAVQPALDYCRDRGIPVIMKSRGSNGVPGVDYVTFVASDFVKEGELAATWIVNAAEKKGIEKIRCIEIQ